MSAAATTTATTGSKCIMSDGVADEQASASIASAAQAQAAGQAPSTTRQRKTSAQTAQAADRSSKPGSSSNNKDPGNGGITVDSDSVFCERRSDGGDSGGACSLQLWSRKALLRRKDIPKHLQFNPYIETGYRPLLDMWGCVMSLFYFHNETINILTHGVPMLYVFMMWKELLPWGDINVAILPWTHLISTVSPWVGSTIYHLFMNHNAGEHCYKSLLHLDMFGIWITQSFGALTTVYASVACLSTPWIWRTLAVYCIISLICLYKALTARCVMARRLSFTLAVVMQLTLLYLRSTPHLMGGGDSRAIIHYFMEDLMAVIGGFIGALRIPEKWIPGRLDLLFNSHHIMHVVVVYAVYHLHQGAILDMIWLSSNYTCLNSTTPL